MSPISKIVAVFFMAVAASSQRESRQIYLFPSGQHQSEHYHHQPSAYPSSIDYYGTNSASGRLFFGLLPGLNPLLNRPSTLCPTCPLPTTCPTPVICPTCRCPAVPVPAALAVATATACTTPATLTTCSLGSLASSGTIAVTFPTAAAGGAVLTIVAQAPNTRVQVNCPTIPAGLIVATQTQALVANTPRIETGFATVVVSGTAGAVNTVLNCVWTSLL